MTISEIKINARRMLMGEHSSFGLMALIFLLIRLISGIVPSFIFSDITAPVQFISAFLLSYLLKVLADMFGVGLSKIAYNISTQRELSPSDIFYAFFNQSDQFLKIKLLFAGIQTILGIPVTLLPVISEKYNFSTPLYYAILLGGSFLSIFISFLITIRLSYSIYILFDDKSLTAMKALKESIRLTKGYYGRIFLLQLSFIGMHLLSILSLALGYTLTLPYIKTSEAILYNELNGHE